MTYQNDQTLYYKGKSEEKYTFKKYLPSTCPIIPGSIWITLKKNILGKWEQINVGHFAEIDNIRLSIHAKEIFENENVEAILLHPVTYTKKEAEKIVEDIKNSQRFQNKILFAQQQDQSRDDNKGLREISIPFPIAPPNFSVSEK